MWHSTNFSSVIRAFSSLDKRKLVALILLVLSTATTSHAQRVDTDPQFVNVREGEKVTLLCQSGQPILYCRITLPGENTFVLSERLQPQQSGYSYAGQGLETGQCGITIESVKRSHNGKMQCFLATTQGLEINGTIPINLSLAPLSPEIDTNSKTFFEANTKMRATCISRDGRPASNIAWLLNDEFVGPGEIDITESFDHDNSSIFTTSNTITQFVNPQDHGKFLRCRVTHPAYPDPGYVETQIQLRVNYGPVALAEQRVTGLQLGRAATVSVVVAANPRPRIQWTIDGNIIKEGQQNDRMVAYEAMDIGGGNYNVTLIISSLTLEDTQRNYNLKASNELGVQEYSVRISSGEFFEDEPIGIGSIIAISVGVIIVLVALLMTVVAKFTHRWCFSGQTLNTDLGQDSEAQINEQDTEDKHEQFEQQPHSEEEVDVTPPAQTNGKAVDAKKGNTSV